MMVSGYVKEDGIVDLQLPFAIFIPTAKGVALVLGEEMAGDEVPIKYYKSEEPAAQAAVRHFKKMVNQVDFSQL